MTRFHTDEYVHFLSRVTPETAEELTYHGTRCMCIKFCNGAPKLTYSHLVLVGDDNPAWDGLFEFCSLSAGGSIGAQYADHHERACTDRK